MTDNTNSLYAAWLDVLPQAFRMLVPAADAEAQPAAKDTSDTASAPLAAQQVGKALELLDGLLVQVYRGFLPLLANGDLKAEPFQALVDSGTKAVDRFVASLAEPLAALQSLPDWAGIVTSAQPWPPLFQTLIPGMQGKPVGTNQLQLGIERTFGGLGEAFGLGPMRELQQAWREMLTASAAKQRAQVEYLAVAVQAWGKGTQGLLQELQAIGARGERIESLLAFIRLWAKAVDGPMHEAMQSARGLEVTAKLISASSLHRQQLQKAIGLASDALHVPTRADMDEAFREIQELKRELRRLKKALPPAAQKKMIQAGEQAA
jgi:class III poly(R)-hydroxyalkanoic acid synthase PhaE subunit